MYFIMASRLHGLLLLRLLTAKTNCSRYDLQFVKQIRSADNLSSATYIYERASLSYDRNSNSPPGADATG
jgi:hypothetical protein